MTDTTTPETKADREVKAAKVAEATAQARLYNAQADKALSEAAAAALQLIQMQHDEMLRLASDHHAHVYRFTGIVNESTARACIAKLNQWHRLDPACDIEVIINSYGGDSTEGMALFDELSALSLRGGGTHRMTVGCRGAAFSMGGILLQAADHRWIGAESSLMIHELSAAPEGKMGELKGVIQHFEECTARVLDIFVKRSEGKCSKEEFAEHWENKNWWIMSGEALARGFVDVVK